MEPVRVKLYGLVTRTRRSYLGWSVFEALFLVACLSFWALGWDRMKPSPQRYERIPRVVQLAVDIVDRWPWLVLAAVLIKAAELWVVLRRFAAKEGEQRRQQAAAAAAKVSAGSG